MLGVQPTEVWLRGQYLGYSGLLGVEAYLYGEGHTFQGLSVEVLNSSTAKLVCPQGVGVGYALTLDYSKPLPSIADSWFSTSISLHYASPAIASVQLNGVPQSSATLPLVITGSNFGLREFAAETSVVIWARNETDYNSFTNNSSPCVVTSVTSTTLHCNATVDDGGVQVIARNAWGPTPPFSITPASLRRPPTISWVGAALCPASAHTLKRELVQGFMEVRTTSPQGMRGVALASLLEGPGGPFPTSGGNLSLAVAGISIIRPINQTFAKPVSIYLVATEDTVRTNGFWYHTAHISGAEEYWNRTIEGNVFQSSKETEGFDADPLSVSELIKCRYGCLKLPAKVINCDAVVSTPSGDRLVVKGKPVHVPAGKASMSGGLGAETVVVVDLPSGQGSGWRLLLASDEQLSFNSVPFSFTKPVITRERLFSQHPSQIPSTGAWVEVEGYNFGYIPASNMTMLDDTPVEVKHDDRPHLHLVDEMGTENQVCRSVGPGRNGSVEVGFWSNTVVRCYLAAGVAPAEELTVVVVLGNGQEGHSNSIVGYRRPVVQAVNPQRAPTSGGTRITVVGEDLIGAVAVTVGGNKCLDLVRHSNHELTCSLPEGSGTSNTVAVSTGRQRSVCEAPDEQCTYAYEPPVIMRVSPSILPVRVPFGEPSRIMLEGRSFGPRGEAIGFAWSQEGYWAQELCGFWDGEGRIPPLNRVQRPTDLWVNTTLEALFASPPTEMKDFGEDGVRVESFCHIYVQGSLSGVNVLKRSHTVLEFLAPVGIGDSIIGALLVSGQMATFELSFQR